MTRLFSDWSTEGKTWRHWRRTPGSVGKTAAETYRCWKQVWQVTTGKTTTTGPEVHSQVSLSTRPRAAKGNRGASAWGGGFYWVECYSYFYFMMWWSFALFSSLGHGSEWISWNRRRSKGKYCVARSTVAWPIVAWLSVVWFRLSLHNVACSSLVCSSLPIVAWPSVTWPSVAWPSVVWPIVARPSVAWLMVGWLSVALPTVAWSVIYCSVI